MILLYLINNLVANAVYNTHTSCDILNLFKLSKNTENEINKEKKKMKYDPKQHYIDQNPQDDYILETEYKDNPYVNGKYSANPLSKKPVSNNNLDNYNLPTNPANIYKHGLFIPDDERFIHFEIFVNKIKNLFLKKFCVTRKCPFEYHLIAEMITSDRTNPTMLVNISRIFKSEYMSNLIDNLHIIALDYIRNRYSNNPLNSNLNMGISLIDINSPELSYYIHLLYRKLKSALVLANQKNPNPKLADVISEILVIN